jgi:hypothetical protein
MARLAGATVCDLPRSTLRKSLFGGAGQERGAFPGALVDAAEQPLGVGLWLEELSQHSAGREPVEEAPSLVRPEEKGPGAARRISARPRQGSV